MCGEQPRVAAAEIVLSGSPPRVRGTVHERGLSHGCVRITPACAGNRPCFTSRAAEKPDHPRVCGEQMRDIHTRCREEGSPPRVRGTATVQILCGPGYRITPACAGNSSQYLQIRSML